MSGSPPRKMRKGTKSCMECRRRKLRCAWTSDSALSCRRCEERSLTCVPQISSTKSGAVYKPNSKQRIAELEDEVLHLNKAVHAIQTELKLDTTRITTPFSGRTASIATLPDDGEQESSDEDDFFERDEVMINDANSRMRNLFHNELLSTDHTHVATTQVEQHRGISQLLDKARVKLQGLIPSKEDVDELSRHVSSWSDMAGEIFPQLSATLPTATPSAINLVSHYEQVTRADTDTWTLAMWLLSLALTAQQMSQNHDSAEKIVQDMTRRYEFAGVVANAVERTLLSHDSLLGTIQGLELSIQFLRLNITRGSIQRTWLYLRRVVAVAELMGLPRSVRLQQNQLASRKESSREDNLRLRTWASICIIDRLCSILHNMPIATRTYRVPTTLPQLETGSPQPLKYIIQLSAIAVEIQDLDDARASQASDADIYVAVLKLDGNLRAVASTLPSSWIAGMPPISTAGQMICFLQYCMTMQVHLHFILRDDSAKQFTYSKLAGTKACQDVARQWLRLRRMLPLGFFLCRVMDVQAFTGTVVMLLLSYSTRQSAAASFDTANAEMESLMAETIQMLEEKSKEPFASDFVREAVETLISLTALLDGRRDVADEPELMLKVPLLGRLRVHRRSRPHAINRESTNEFTRKPTNSGYTLPQFPQQHTSNHTASQTPAPSTIGADSALSWLIEDDYDSLFQNYLASDLGESWQDWQSIST